MLSFGIENYRHLTRKPLCAALNDAVRS